MFRELILKVPDLSNMDPYVVHFHTKPDTPCVILSGKALGFVQYFSTCVFAWKANQRLGGAADQGSAGSGLT